MLTKWWEQLLHNQSALMLKARLLFRRNTVVVSVPYHIDGATVDVPGVMESHAGPRQRRVGGAARVEPTATTVGCKAKRV